MSYISKKKNSVLLLSLTSEKTAETFEATLEVDEVDVGRILSILGAGGIGKIGLLSKIKGQIEGQPSSSPQMQEASVLLLLDGLKEPLQPEMRASGERKIVLYEKNLTPQILKEEIPRLVEAIEKIQQIISEIKGIEFKSVAISKIEQHSPVSISLGGATEAIDLLRRILVPWQREHYREIAHLEEREKQVEIELKKAEILERRARAAKERREAEKLLAEATKQRQEAERLRLENSQLRLTLEREKIRLAIEMVKEIAPNLPEEEKLGYIIKILSAINALVELNIEII